MCLGEFRRFGPRMQANGKGGGTPENAEVDPTLHNIQAQYLLIRELSQQMKGIKLLVPFGIERLSTTQIDNADVLTLYFATPSSQHRIISLMQDIFQSCSPRYDENPPIERKDMAETMYINKQGDNVHALTVITKEGQPAPLYVSSWRNATNGSGVTLLLPASQDKNCMSNVKKYILLTVRPQLKGEQNGVGGVYMNIRFIGDSADFLGSLLSPDYDPSPDIDMYTHLNQEDGADAIIDTFHRINIHSFISSTRHPDVLFAQHPHYDMIRAREIVKAMENPAV